MTSKLTQSILPLLLLAAAVSSCGADPSNAQAEASHADAGHDEHDEHDEGDEHDEHEEGDEHGEERHVELTDEEAQAIGVVVSIAEVGSIGDALSLPAEIRFDPDRVVNIATPVGGIVRSLLVVEGDWVEEGDTLATLSSRELADLKAEFLAAQSTENLAQAALVREERLRAENITAEADLLAARAEMARASAAREAAETKLHALDLGHEVIDSLAEAEDGTLSLFPLTTPLAGQVVQRSVTRGDTVEPASGADRPLFVVADLSVVWADVAVFKHDLGSLRTGANVVLADEAGAVLADGELSFISPVVDEMSRTASARVIVDNTDGALRPGQFVTARVETGDAFAVTSAVQVPEASVQLIEGRETVFVPNEGEGGFVARPVTTGRRAGEFIEIVAGLEQGDSYVASGAFTLRAELEKSEFGDGHDH